MNIEILKFKIKEKHKLIDMYTRLYDTSYKTEKKIIYKRNIDDLLKDINKLINTPAKDIELNKQNIRF